MLSYAVLAILVLQYVNSSSCPSGYDVQAFDLCYKAYLGPSNYYEASTQCLKDGGRLASIHNAFTNALILDLADYVGNVLWIGLICTDANPKNCVWDDGQVGADQYNAFHPGYPLGGNSDAHWYYIINSKNSDAAGAGKWGSNLYNAPYGFVCEVSIRDLANITDLARNSRQH